MKGGDEKTKEETRSIVSFLAMVNNFSSALTLGLFR
jgi:hypothetical protein